MRKKFLLSALAILATLGVSAGLAGCDLVDGILGDGNKDKDNTTNTGDKDGNKDNGNSSIIEKPGDLQSVKSEQVNAATWNAAFDASNFSNSKVVFSTSQNFAGETSVAMDYTAISAGNIFHAQAEQKAGSRSEKVNLYIDSTKSPEVVYVKNGDEAWKIASRSECAEFTLEECIEMFSMYDYSMFTYSATEGYVFTESGSSMNTKICYKFSGGKFVGAHVEVTGSGGTATTDVRVTYGGQSVSIPQSVITEANKGGSSTTKPDDGNQGNKPDDGNQGTNDSAEVNARQFATALDLSSFDNVKMINYGESYTAGMTVVNKCESIKANGVEHAVVQQDMSGLASGSYSIEIYADYNQKPTYYYSRYSAMGNKWSGSTESSYSSMTIDNFFNSMPEGLTDYNSYTYDSNKKCYTAHAEADTSGATLKYDVTATFSDGKLVRYYVTVNGETHGYADVTFTYGGYKMSIPEEVIKEAGGSATTKPDDNPVGPSVPTDKYTYEYSDDLASWDKLPSEKVSSAVWANAVGRENYTIYKAVVTEYSKEGILNQMVIVRGANGCLHAVQPKSDAELYIDFNTWPINSYEKAEGRWQASSDGYPEDFDPVYYSLGQFMNGDYDRYSFNGQNNCYYYKSASDNLEYFVKIYKGKLVGFKMVGGGTDGYEFKLDYSNPNYMVEIPPEAFVGGGETGSSGYDRFTNTWHVESVQNGNGNSVAPNGEILFDFKPNGELYVHVNNPEGMPVSYEGYYYPDKMYCIVSYGGNEYRFDILELVEGYKISLGDSVGLLGGKGYMYEAYCGAVVEPANPYRQFEGAWKFKYGYNGDGSGLSLDCDLIFNLKEDGMVYLEVHGENGVKIYEGNYIPEVGGFLYLNIDGEEERLTISGKSDYELQLGFVGGTLVLFR